MNIAFDNQGNRYEAKTTADWAKADLVVSVENGVARVEKCRLTDLILGMAKHHNDLPQLEG